MYRVIDRNNFNYKMLQDATRVHPQPEVQHNIPNINKHHMHSIRSEMQVSQVTRNATMHQQHVYMHSPQPQQRTQRKEEDANPHPSHNPEN